MIKYQRLLFLVTTLGLFGVFAAGILVGRFFLDNPGEEESGKEPFFPVDEYHDQAEGDLKQLREKVADLELRNSELLLRIAELEKEQTENSKIQPEGFVSLTERAFEVIHIPVFSFGGLKLTEEISEVMRFTEGERASIEKSLERMNREIRDYERLNLEEVWKDGDTPEYRIPMFSEKGQQMRAELKKHFQTTLGIARADQFFRKAGNELNEAFSYFGQAEKRITINDKLRFPVGYSRNDMIRISEMFYDSSGNYLDGRNYSSKRGLPDRLSHLFEVETLENPINGHP